MGFINRPSEETDSIYEAKDTALTDFNSRQFKTWIKKMAARLFLNVFFSAWLAIRCLKILKLRINNDNLFLVKKKLVLEVLGTENQQNFDNPEIPLRYQSIYAKTMVHQPSAGNAYHKRHFLSLKNSLPFISKTSILSINI